jgi:hypothetical protein
MRPCAVYINQSALDSACISGTQRQLVLEFIRWLADHPIAEIKITHIKPADK